MTGSMAVARAIASVGGGSAWPRVTHLSSNSGGSWFSSMFAYDSAFHEAVVGEGALSDVISAYATSLAEAYAARQASIATWQPRTGFFTLCAAFDVAISTVANLFINFGADVPASWQPYTEAVLAAADSAMPASTYSSAPRANLSATLIQMAALPPDAHLEISGSSASASLLVDGGAIQYAVPIALAVDATGAREWRYNSAATLSVQGSSPAALSLPADPTIGMMTASSSAAAGCLTSSTMTGQAISPLAAALLGQCLPVLEAHGVPIDGSSSVAVFPQSYRLVDGGYADNSGVAMGLARLQSDCAHATVDCLVEPPKIVLVDHGQEGDDASTRKLFRMPASQQTVLTQAGGAITHWSAAIPSMLAPLATIFDADYPSSTGFTSYGSGASLYWRGTLTTLANQWYGVTGGLVVDVLILHPRTTQQLVPAASYRVSTPAEQQQYAAAFTTEYASEAAAQAAALAPVLSSFFA